MGKAGKLPFRLINDLRLWKRSTRSHFRKIAQILEKELCIQTKLNPTT
jgi:hypothetical protein